MLADESSPLTERKGISSDLEEEEKLSIVVCPRPLLSPDLNSKLVGLTPFKSTSSSSEEEILGALESLQVSSPNPDLSCLIFFPDPWADGSAPPSIPSMPTNPKSILEEPRMMNQASPREHEFIVAKEK
nr:hypothetical protein Itr_chr05CG04090 [Ipomoea trifida]